MVQDRLLVHGLAQLVQELAQLVQALGQGCRMQADANMWQHQHHNP
jgi:hypothetical protein